MGLPPALAAVPVPPSHTSTPTPEHSQSRCASLIRADRQPSDSRRCRSVSSPDDSGGGCDIARRCPPFEFKRNSSALIGCGRSEPPTNQVDALVRTLIRESL